LTTDIFNFSSRGAPRDGKIVTGCLVVNKFYFEDVQNLVNDDAKVFSELFSKKDNVLFAGKEQPQTETEDGKTKDGITRDGKTEDGRKKYGRPENDNRVVTYDDINYFIFEMRRQIRETENISAIGKS